jgi:Phage phiEco32-like COOH.NH2 ligase-type 2
MKILVGCDPEVFVKKNNKFVSGFGLIRGDKKQPFPVKDGAVQVDGMALEFNINPAENEDQFVHSVQSVFDQMCKMVPEYEVVAVPVAHFDADYMKQQPKEALELGCDPDYNAWTGLANERPNGDRPMRTASGHVHIGWTKGKSKDDVQHQYRGALISKQLDFYLGLASLFYDDDKERREMYGKAGACRFKPYGVEYRTLSNAWLRSEDRMRWVYRNAVAGVKALIAGDILSETYGDIQEIINTSNKKEAMKIIKKAGLELCNG